MQTKADEIKTLAMVAKAIQFRAKTSMELYRTLLEIEYKVTPSALGIAVRTLVSAGLVVYDDDGVLKWIGGAADSTSKETKENAI